MDTSGPLSAAALASARQVLHEAPYAYLAVTDPGGPYVVPLNFAYMEDGRAAAQESACELSGRVVFHTGQGRKTAAIAADARVCLAVTAGTAFQQGDSPCADAFSYRSVLLWGRARRIEEDAEREAALRAIVAKHDPGAAGLPFGEADFARTLLYEILIEAVSYKQQP